MTPPTAPSTIERPVPERRATPRRPDTQSTTSRPSWFRTKTPRVAMIGSRGFPGQTGGVERVLEAVAPRMVQHGRAGVSVYCADWLDYDGPEYDGVELRRVGGVRSKYGDTFTRSLIASIREMWSDSDVVHYHSIGSAPLAILPRLRGKKVVTTVHALDWQRSKWNVVARTFLRFGQWASVRIPDRTVVVGEELKTYLEDQYHQPITHIPNGAEIRNHVPPRLIRDAGLEPGKYLLFLARLVPEKGVHTLIEAFRRLPADGSMKLAIAGPAWYESEYNEMLHELAGDDPRVVFLGEVDGRLLEELYSNCYAYVLPSEVEGMSLSLLDALAYGCCIVTSSIPPNARLVEDAGLTFETGNVESLTERLNQVLSDEDFASRLRGRAAERGQRYSWDTIADEWADVYDELLAS